MSEGHLETVSAPGLFGESAPLLNEPAFRRGLRLAIMMPAVVLGAVVALLTGLTLFLFYATEWLSHTDRIIGQTSEIAELAVDMETGLRAYQLTSDEIFLQPWKAALPRIGPAQENLVELVGDDPSQTAAAADQRKALAAWRSYAEETLQRVRDGGDVHSVSWNSQGKALFDHFRESTARFLQEEHQIRDARQNTLRRLRISVLAALACVAIGGIPLLIQLLRQYIRRVNDAYHDSLAIAHTQRDELHTSLNSIGDAVVATDEMGTVTFLNPVAEQLTGWTLIEARGLSLAEVMPIFNVRTGLPAEDLVARVMRERVIIGLANHTVLRRRDGKEFAIEDSAAPMFKTDGTIRGMILVFHDVTEKYARERLLRASEDRAGAIVETSLDGVLLMDTSGIITGWNAAAERIFGWSREEVLDKELAAYIIPERLRESHRKGLAHLLATGKGPVLGRRLELPALRCDGTEFPVELSINPLPGSGPKMFVGFIRDISQRRAAEAELAERSSLATLRAEVGALLSSTDAIETVLHGCCDLLVRHLDAAFARVWTLDDSGTVLVLDASAGLYTHLDGAHARVPVGQFKIGRIAKSRRAHLSNDVANDPNISDPEWAAQEGMVAFAGYPLIAEGELLGVVALFARHVLSQNVLGDLAPIADAIAASLARRHVQIALIAEKERAESSARAKDNFLAALSHELRTPLTPVLMTAAALQEDERLPEDVRSQLSMIERNIALESRLIDDMLDLTRLTKGKLTMREEVCDVHSLIGLVVEILRDEARSKPVSVEVDLAARRSGLRGDPARLQQVFWNLLRNAIKFTPAGGRVTIRTRDETDERLRIEVIDTGIGLREEALDQIFQPFEQAGDDSDHRFGGLGLGLAIARAIVDLHGGSVHAESAGVGLGANFIVELPGVGEQARGVSAPSTPSMASSGAINQPPLRLLIVEDHEATRAVLKRLLLRSGHQVVTAGSVAAATAAAQAGNFDVVISDLGLPDGTGIEVMTRLRQLFPNIRGIALSGYGMEKDLKRSQEAGFTIHLVKPVDLDQLRRALRDPAESPDAL
jgi:PAS domain S-box-containing protein